MTKAIEIMAKVLMVLIYISGINAIAEELGWFYGTIALLISIAWMNRKYLKLAIKIIDEMEAE